VWMRGSVPLNSRGVTLRELTLCVPVNQRRAVFITNQASARRHQVSPHRLSRSTRSQYHCRQHIPS
jgi:hypothetical protein